MKKMVRETMAILGIFGIAKPKSKADYVRQYLTAVEKAESLCDLTASQFEGVEDYKDVIFKAGIWRKDILPSAERKRLRAGEKSVDELTERLYRLEKAIRQRVRRQRKKTEGKHNDAGPAVRLSPRVLAMAILSDAREGTDADLYLAGVLEGLAFEPSKAQGEKTFAPSYQRFLEDVEVTWGGKFSYTIDTFKRECERIKEKSAKGEGLTPKESSILNALQSVI